MRVLTNVYSRPDKIRRALPLSCGQETVQQNASLSASPWWRVTARTAVAHAACPRRVSIAGWVLSRTETNMDMTRQQQHSQDSMIDKVIGPYVARPTLGAGGWIRCISPSIRRSAGACRHVAPAMRTAASGEPRSPREHRRIRAVPCHRVPQWWQVIFAPSAGKRASCGGTGVALPLVRSIRTSLGAAR